LQKTKPSPLAATAREWANILAKYREPSHARSVLELIVTASGFAVLWFMAWAVLGVSPWLSLLTALPAAGFLVRLFMIQHDCGYGAFFRHRLANDWLGRVIGTLTLTPYDAWRRSHAIHHGSAGNLEKRGIGDITTLTVREYLASSRWQRLYYRLYRNPLILFGLGPAYLFFVRHRLPLVGLMHGGVRPWISTMLTNAAIALIVFVMMWFVGVGPFLIVHLPITLLAASIGVWLFYVQHHSRIPSGLRPTGGTCTTQHFTAAPTTRCRAFYAGLRPISAHTPLQPNPLLSAPACAAQPSRAQLNRTRDTVSKPRLRPAGVVGRKTSAIDFVL